MKSPPKHVAVISGVCGLMPESHDVDEFLEKLYDGVDLVKHPLQPDSLDGQKVPTRRGVIPRDFVYDDTFFGISSNLTSELDLNTSLSMSCAFGAVIDAELRGSNTGVFSAVALCEINFSLFEKDKNHYHVIEGASRCMGSNRISFYMDLKGPSIMLQTSWTGVILAMRQAKDMIESGAIPAAIIVATQFINCSSFQFLYDRFGVLSSDCATKSFSDDDSYEQDATLAHTVRMCGQHMAARLLPSPMKALLPIQADGYARSEGVIAFFMQRKSEARRIYAEVVDLLADEDLSKNARLTDIPDKEFLVTKLKKLYDRCGVDPAQVAYVEGSGLGLKKVDAVELNSLAEVLIRPGRRHPLLVGSVKSNAGHAEGAADALAILKTVLAANHGLIPRNIHFAGPNSAVPALLEGTMKVVTENTALEGDLLAVNAVSMLHSVGHAIFRRHPKTSDDLPTIAGVLPADRLPRLFVMSGRTLERTMATLEKVENQPIDPNFIALSNQVFKNGIKGHIHRAFTVLNDKGITSRESYDYFSGTKTPPVWFVFTGMGSQWLGMGAMLMAQPIVARAIRRCHDILTPKGLDLIGIITSMDTNIFSNILHSFVGITAIQIGLVDLLYEVGVRPDGMIGHSVGELACAYADGCFTAEQTILATYARGMASLEATLIPGMMAAVGMGYQEIKNSLPDDVEVACHNSSTSCTLSGPTDSVARLVESLTTKGVFAKLVNVSNIAYHSKYIKPAEPYLLRRLKKVIPEPRARSPKWIPSSIPEKDWDSELAKYSSPEYHTNNLLSPVLFEEASAHIPEDAVIVEIAPHGLLQAVLKRAFPQAHNIPLTSARAPSNLVFLYQAFGKLYNRGVTLDLEKLYPPVQFPVPRGTKSLSPLLNWTGIPIPTPRIHFNGFKDESCQGPRLRTVTFTNELKNLNEYIVKGTPVIPFSVYVKMCIDEIRSSCNRRENKDLRFFHISNLRLYQLVPIEDEAADLWYGLGKNFEVSQNEKEVFSLVPNNYMHETREHIHTLQKERSWSGGVCIPVHDVYDRLEFSGINLSWSLKLITSLNQGIEGIRATIKWNGNFPSFLESCLLLPVIVFGLDDEVSIVTKIDELFLDFSQFPENERKVITVEYHHSTNVIRTAGLTIINPTVQRIPFDEVNPCVFTKPTLSPYMNNVEEFEFDGSSPVITLSHSDWLTKLQYVLENHPNSIVYLVGPSHTVEEMYYFYLQCSDLPNSNQIRYIFHDSSFNPRLHINQLKKGSKVNVYYNGDWAVLKPNIVHIPSQPSTCYTFSRLRKHETEINAFGLTLEDNNFSPKVVDYCGLRRGRKVCGIGYINDESLAIIPDPVLCWEKPDGWTDEEVASCLLPYTLGYYLFMQHTASIFTNESSESMVLVHQGHLHISQAVINLALNNKYTVYTTYNTDVERKLIQTLFPQIPYRNILDYENSEEILKEIAKRNNGFELILNTFPETETLESCCRLLCFGGSVYRVTSQENIDKSLGLFTFLRGLAVWGITPNSLKQISNGDKETLRALVERGLREGQITPMSHCALNKGTTNQEVIQLLRDSNIKERLIISMNTEVHNSLQYHAAFDATHLIIANENTTYFFNIIEWLIKRDALHIDIIMNFTENSTTAYKRLRDIIKKNPQVFFNLNTLDKMRNDTLQTYIQELKLKRSLSFILISGDLEDSKLNMIIEEAGECQIIYIHEKCNSRFLFKNKKGLEIIDKNKLSHGSFHKFLDGLFKYSGNLLYVSNKISEFRSEVVELPEDRSSQLPTTVEEVVELGRREVGWQEVRTLSLPCSSCRELPPVFLIPSITKHSLLPLISKLFLPAFIARIPRAKSLQEIACLLYQVYKKFDLNVFNLICTDMNYKLGLLLSKVMEENGKRVVLIVINSSYNWKNHELLKNSEQSILSHANELAIFRRTERLVETGLEVMKERLQLFSADPTPPLEKKLKGMVVLIQRKVKSSALQAELEQHTKSPINVVTAERNKTFCEMITSKDIIKVINSVVLHEIKDSDAHCREVTNLSLKLINN